MTTTAERLLGDLQIVMTEIEDLFRQTASKAGAQVGNATDELQTRFESVREQMADLEAEVRGKVKRAAQAADASVQANPWAAVAIAAAAGFLLGLAFSRREPGSAPPEDGVQH
jgi:ElaB/YqjD/DUF883 family membrane-anchored ribosome-binding protein